MPTGLALTLTLPLPLPLALALTLNLTLALTLVPTLALTLALTRCALKSASSKFSKFCALICSPSLPILDQKAADSQCGENASCKEAGTGVGICTYDD